MGGNGAGGVAGIGAPDGAGMLVDQRLDLYARGVVIAFLGAGRDRADRRAAGARHRVVVGIEPKAKVSGKYLVKFDSIKGLEYELFCNNPNFIIEPYEGYAEWVDEDDLIKVKEECEEEVMSEFNIGDKVVPKGYPNLGEEVGVVVGRDTRGEVEGKYLVKFDSLDEYSGWACRVYINDPYYIIEPYEGRAIWLDEDDLEKVENECEEKCEEEHEEDIKIKFERIREQKKEVVKEMSEKVLELTLEIKEIEHEIEKIKKEWHLD